MNFLFGMLIVGMLSDGKQASAMTTFGDIPFRCFGALEQSESAYKRCRRPSLVYVLVTQMKESSLSGMSDRSDLSKMLEDSLEWEIVAIKKLSAEAAKGAAK